MPADEARALKAKVRKILDRLEKAHPDARVYLDFETPFQLLIATILAAQCTDQRVNQVTPGLFRRWSTPKAFADADRAELEQAIRSTGTFRRKAEAIQECCRTLVEEHDGEVPDDAVALTAVRGVGRKTANVVVGAAFGKQAIAVDTHVWRVSTRLGLATAKQPDKIEQELCAIIPERRWTRATQLLGTHGRRICAARKPDCEHCPVSALCDYPGSIAVS